MHDFLAPFFLTARQGERTAMMTALLVISLIIGIIMAWPSMAGPKPGGLRLLDFDRRKALERGLRGQNPGKTIRAKIP
jgi:hypothetical protein